MSTNILWVLVGGGMLLYGLYRCWKLIDLVRRQNVRDSWTLTTGEVYYQDVKESWGGRGGKSYEPVISYRYTVMGKVFKNTISLGSSSRRSSAEDTLALVADKIKIYYNPEKPKEHISSEEEVRTMQVVETIIYLFMGLLLIIGAIFGFPVTGTGHGRK